MNRNQPEPVDGRHIRAIIDGLILLGDKQMQAPSNGASAVRPPRRYSNPLAREEAIDIAQRGDVPQFEVNYYCHYLECLVPCEEYGLYPADELSWIRVDCPDSQKGRKAGRLSWHKKSFTGGFVCHSCESDLRDFAELVGATLYEGPTLAEYLLFEAAGV